MIARAHEARENFRPRSL